MKVAPSRVRTHELNGSESAQPILIASGRAAEHCAQPNSIGEQNIGPATTIWEFTSIIFVS